MKSSKEKFFYGWVIVGVGILIMACTVGIANNCLSLYIVPICDDLGFTRKAGGFMMTLLSVGNIFVAAVSAWIYRVFNIKSVMRVCAVVLSGIYFCYSLATELWMFYLITFIAACCVWLMAYIPFALLLNRWFHKRGGFVIGLTYMGTGIGGMIFSKFIGTLIHSVGWRQTTVIISIIMGAVLIPLSFLIRDDPSEKGLKPYGYSPDEPIEAEQYNGLMLYEAVKTKQFIILVLGIALSNFCINGYATSFAPYLSDIGYPITMASAILSMQMVSLAIGKLSLGWIYDRFSIGTGIAISFSCLILTIISALMLPSKIMLAGVIGGYSMGFAFGSVAVPIIVRSSFGMRDFGRINGAVQTISGIVAATGPMLSGFICDTTGSYATGYKLYAVVSIAAMLMMLGCFGKKAKA